MRPFHEIIRRAVVTEKSFANRSLGRYTFEVASDAGKAAIREAVQNFFKVEVAQVRTITVHGKVRKFGKHTGRKPSWKKAVVTLASGQTIKMLEAE